MLLSTILGGLTPAPAQAQAAERQFDIPAQSLGDALMTFGRQSGMQVTAEGPLVEGRSSSAVSGRLSAAQALSQLLSGSGLTFRYIGTNAVRLERAPQAEHGAIQLGPVRVEGNGASGQGNGTDPVAEIATSPVNGYVARRSATGTKTDTPLLETPQSISIVGAEEIRVRHSTSLIEALGYTAGVANAANRGGSADLTNDGFILRGFNMDAQSGSYYRDGTKYTVNPYNGRQELYALERVEVLKGASSVLYGTAGPGGIINVVSKRPTNTPLHEMNVEYGSYDRKQASADFSGPLTDDGTLGYRITGLVRDSDTFTDFTPDNRVFLDSSFVWRPSDRTSLTFLGEYQKDRTRYNDGLPAAGTVLPNPNGLIPRGRFVGEPGHDRYDLDRWSVGYLFEHKFSDNVTLRNNFRYFDARANYSYTFRSGVPTDFRNQPRNALDRWDRSSSIVSDTSVQITAQTGQIAHTLVAGVDYARQKHETERYFRLGTPLDLFDPVYGGSLSAPEPMAFSSKGTTRAIGVYAQDQMKIADKLVISVGGRHDWVKIDTCAFFEPANCLPDEYNKAFTGRAGVVYLFDNGLAPYVSFSQSFEPQSDRDRGGNRLKPTRGRQWEMGLRFQPEKGNTLITAALYSLTRSNVPVTDPVDTNYVVQLGAVRARGIELEAKTGIGRYANIIAAYTYTDARSTRSSPLTPELEGAKTAGVPEQQFSLWGDYDLAGLGVAGFKTGAGVRYVGATKGLYVSATVPSYTLVDALLSYSTGPWSLAVNATNLFDKTYVTVCGGGCFYGEPRRVTGTLSYRW